MSAAQAQEIATRFVDAFSDGDIEAMRAVLADDMTSFITNADGGTDVVEGADGLLARIEAMDLPSANYSVQLTQPPVPVPPDKVLAMVEIRAERGGRTLHNFAAHLLTIAGDEISEWRMADAKPAESDAFWAAPGDGSG
jgi:ketosteroid isomerase-like protein